MLKKILLTIGLLGLCCSNAEADYHGIFKRTDTLAISFFMVDSAGSHVEPNTTADSGGIFVWSSGGDSVYAERFRLDDARVDLMNTPAGGFENTIMFADLISVLDGASTAEGTFAYIFQTWDASLTAVHRQIDFRGSFTIVDDFNDQVLRDSLFAILDTLQLWDTRIDSMEAALADQSINDKVWDVPYAAVDAGDWGDSAVVKSDFATKEELAAVTADSTLGHVDTGWVADSPGDKIKSTLDTLENQDDWVAQNAYFDTLIYHGPFGLGVYIDSTAGNTNTVVGVDGTEKNPVSTFVAARTLADAMGRHRYYLVGRSTFNGATTDLAASHLDWDFIGIGQMAEMAFGGQNTDGSRFQNLGLSGAMHASQSDAIYEDCSFGFISANYTGHAFRCFFTDTIVLKNATDIEFNQCVSGVAGNNTPTIDFSAGSTAANLRHYSGGLRLMNATTLDTISVETDGQVIISANNTTLHVTVRGMATITDSGTTTDLTKDAVFSRSESNLWVPGPVWNQLMDSGFAAGTAGDSAKGWGATAASALDSTILSNVLHRIVWGTPVGSGSDSSTLAQRDATIAAFIAGILDSTAFADSAFAAKLFATNYYNQFATKAELVDATWDKTIDTAFTAGSAGDSAKGWGGAGGTVTLAAGQFSKIRDTVWQSIFATVVAGSYSDSLKQILRFADTANFATALAVADSVLKYVSRAGKNIVRNATFEEDSVATTTAPAGWTQGIGDEAGSGSRTAESGGGRYQYASASSTNTTTILYQHLGELPGGDYWLGGTVFSRNNTDAYILIDNEIPTTTSSHIDSVSPAAQDTLLEIGKIVKIAAFTDIYIGLRMDELLGGDTFRFDNIKLIPITRDTSVYQGAAGSLDTTDILTMLINNYDSLMHNINDSVWLELLANLDGVTGSFGDSAQGWGGGAGSDTSSILTMLINNFDSLSHNINDSVWLELLATLDGVAGSFGDSAGGWGATASISGSGPILFTVGATDTSGTDTLVSGVPITLRDILGNQIGVVQTTNSNGHTSWNGTEADSLTVQILGTIHNAHIWPATLDTIVVPASVDTFDVPHGDSILMGYDISITLPPSDSQTTVYGDIMTPASVGVEGVTITASLRGLTAIDTLNGVVVGPDIVSTTTDSLGHWELPPLLRSSHLKLVQPYIFTAFKQVRVGQSRLKQTNYYFPTDLVLPVPDSATWKLTW